MKIPKFRLLNSSNPFHWIGLIIILLTEISYLGQTYGVFYCCWGIGFSVIIIGWFSDKEGWY